MSRVCVCVCVCVCEREREREKVCACVRETLVLEYPNARMNAHAQERQLR